MVAGKKDHNVNIKVGESIIEESEEAPLLGIIVDRDLTFKNYLNKKIKKANSKISAIKRNQHFLTFFQKKIVQSSFVHCHFSYAPLAWMFKARGGGPTFLLGQKSSWLYMIALPF